MFTKRLFGQTLRLALAITILALFLCPLVYGAGGCTDFDNDGKTDFAVFRPSEGKWYIYGSSTGLRIINWGISGDILTPGRRFSIGNCVASVYRPSNNTWYSLADGGNIHVTQIGNPGDIPVPWVSTEYALYRPSTGQWILKGINDSNETHYTWGLPGDIPVAYLSNASSPAVFRPSDGTWYVQISAQLAIIAHWGIAGDKPVPADYDGDGTTDFAVFRPSDGNWYIFRSSDQQVQIIHWGVATDQLVPGDYDGDGKADVGVYRDGQWFIYQSTQGPLIANWGLPGDIPIPSAYGP